MPALIITLSVLAETLLFAQLPIALIVPGLSVAALIYLAGDLAPGELIIYSMSAGLLYDIIRGGSYQPAYFLAFTLCGLAIFVLQENLSSDNRRRRHFNYLVLAAVCSLFMALLPAAPVIDGLGYRIVAYTFIVQFIFLAAYLSIIRLAVRRG